MCLGRYVYMVFGVRIQTLQTVDFQVIIQNSNSSTFYSMANVNETSCHKEKEVFWKRVNYVYKTSRMYVLVRWQVKILIPLQE